MKNNIKNKSKGSAVLIVVLSSIAFFIYAMSVYSESEHFSIIQNKYEKQIVNKYEKNENEFYEDVLNKYNLINNIY